mmetsp:Transcript_10536/g.24425  ORF Transcript_10536/g.24425 Transcript_10536/m.24425 type:complete len:211 (+) Transcript_10536:470-1102(+)
MPRLLPTPLPWPRPTLRAANHAILHDERAERGHALLVERSVESHSEHSRLVEGRAQLEPVHLLQHGDNRGPILRHRLGRLQICAQRVHAFEVMRSRSLDDKHELGLALLVELCFERSRPCHHPRSLRGRLHRKESALAHRLQLGDGSGLVLLGLLRCLLGRDQLRAQRVCDLLHDERGLALFVERSIKLRFEPSRRVEGRAQFTTMRLRI